MHPEEADDVAGLLLRANTENLAGFPADVARGYRVELLDVAGRPVGVQTYVLQLDGRLAGTVAFVPDAADDSHPWPHGGSVLRFLAVEPEHRGAALGERLTAFCIERAAAQRARFLALHTAPAMGAARGIYEKLGFVRAPEHDFDPAGHYGRGRNDDPPWGLAYLLALHEPG